MIARRELIPTVSGRGYQFTAEVTWEGRRSPPCNRTGQTVGGEVSRVALGWPLMYGVGRVRVAGPALGELRGKLDMLEVSCRKCERRDRLSLERLIAEHGADMGATRVASYPRRRLPATAAVTINDQCGVHYPQLPALFPPSQRG